MMLLGLVLAASVSGQPDPFDKVATARWMVHTLDWGVLSTTSTRSQGAHLHGPFGNPYSFADVRGVPYFYASDLDASMIDAFTATSANPRASLALSEASLNTTNGTLPACTIRQGL